MDKYRKTVVYLVTVLIIFIAIGTVALHTLEGWPWLDSMYWCVMSLLTIGDTSHSPSHDATKLFVMAYAIVGVSTFLYSMSVLITHILERNQRHFEKLDTVPRGIGRMVQKMKRKRL